MYKFKIMWKQENYYIHCDHSNYVVIIKTKYKRAAFISKANALNFLFENM